MEKSKRKLTQTKRYIWTMSFCVRMSQTALLSVIPSILSIILLFFNTNVKAWSVASGLAYMILLGGSCFFLHNYMVKRRNVIEYYIINTTVFIIYFISSWTMLNFATAMEYSWFFANMRFFESLTAFIPSLTIKTKYSVIISNSLMFIAMIVMEKLSHIKIKKILAEIEENKLPEAEINENLVINDAAPTQNDEEIKILSIEEMERQIEQDAIESKEIIESKFQGEKNSDVLDGSEMTQGKGKKVERIDYSKLSEDELLIDAVKSESNNFENYDSDSLWDIDLSDYKDDGTDESYDFVNNIIDTNDEYDNEQLWNIDKSRLGNDDDQDDFYKNQNDDYDSESLWDIDASRLGTDDEE